MRRLINRTAAAALCVTVAFSAAAMPCAAAEAPAPQAKAKLTQLSAASRQVLATQPAAALASPLASPKLRRSEGGRRSAGQPQQPAGAPAAPSSFFKSTRGKITLALMAAGVGFTVWSISHDRKPVKSPIR